MPAFETYRHYFDIDPDYFAVVNYDVINEQPDLWKKFYPHDTFMKLIKNTIDVLTRRQKASIWVEGPYGTGKSHAVLTLKKLLDSSEEETKAYFDKYNLGNDCFNQLQSIKNAGKILSVHRIGSSNINDDNDLFFSIQESVEKALQEAGIENHANLSLRKSILRYLSDHDNKESFNAYVKGGYSDLFGGDTIDGIIKKLETYQDNSLQSLMDKIFKVSQERHIHAFTLTADDLKDWLKEVIHKNNLKAIVFIWDEFTEYFYKNKRNLTGFQQICELSATEPFYFIIVTHLSQGLVTETDDDFSKINDRFVKPHSIIELPENIAFQLMGAALEKNKDVNALSVWQNVKDELTDITKESRKIVSNTITNIKEQELCDILPIHPYAALVLKHISVTFDSNQRSMFDFIKNDRGEDIKGFQWFIDNYGPDNANPLLTIDMLWDFFYEKGKDFLASDVKNILDYYPRTERKITDEDEKRVLKTILILQAISEHAGNSIELFIPNEKNLNYAFEGSDLTSGEAGNLAEKLIRDKIIYKIEIGNNKFQYKSYTQEIPVAELDNLKKEISRKSTTALITDELSDGSAVTDAITLDGSLGLRYDMKYASLSDFDTKKKEFRNYEIENKIPTIVVFAKDDTEGASINKKIKDALKEDDLDVVFIDTTTTPLGRENFEQYKNEVASATYYRSKNATLSDQYTKNAKGILNSWKNNIINGSFIVYTKDGGEDRVNQIDQLEISLKNINKHRFPQGLESTYDVLPTLYKPTNLKQGVKCGVTKHTENVYNSKDPGKKLEVLFEDAWNENYWKTKSNILISKIKIATDNLITNGLKNNNGRISIRSIYDMLKSKPYGFMPCSFTAFVMGILLKEYTNGVYNWSDGLTSEPLNLEKLQEMVAEVIQLDNTPNSNYRDKYICEMTEAEKAFNDATSVIFNIPLNQCTSVENTRELIRNKMKDFSFPIWTAKNILSQKNMRTDRRVIEDLIDDFCQIANNANPAKSGSDNDIAQRIGNMCINHPFAKDDLREILTPEACTEGMKIYLKEFKGGELIELSEKIGDNGQYINALRSKFNSEAANWAWNRETVQDRIEEQILEYKIIYESNKIIPKNTSFSSTIDGWCDRCKYIKISYYVLKNTTQEIAPFLEALYNLKNHENTSISWKNEFLNLLLQYGDNFKRFYNNQVDVFKDACSYYIDEFNDEEINEIFSKIPEEQFTAEKNEYMNLVNKKVEEFRVSSKNIQLKNLWIEKTQTKNPREWSTQHSMPVLCLVPDNDIIKAKEAFAAVNENQPNTGSIEKAIKYLKNATFFDIMNDKKALDKIFKEKIIESYSVMLDNVDEVKNYLNNKVSAEPYDWFGLPEVKTRLKKMAEAKYDQSGCSKALEKIENMNVDDLKHYLKELIKDNMVVGMEIIKHN